MERLPVEGTLAPAMQWVCSTEVLPVAREASRALLRTQSLGVQIWHLDDWAAMVAEGVACETAWRRGQRAQVDSRFARLLADTEGALLVATGARREVAESLRAFAPAGRPYLGLWGAEALDAAVLAQAALRLEQSVRDEWVRLSAI